jgi:hypothetical protein
MSERRYKLLNGYTLYVDDESLNVSRDISTLTIETSGDEIIDQVFLLLDQTKSERDRLHKTLKDALKLMDKKLYGIAHKNLVEALAVGQEGEGNQVE